MIPVNALSDPNMPEKRKGPQHALTYYSPAVLEANKQVLVTVYLDRQPPLIRDGLKNFPCVADDVQ